MYYTFSPQTIVDNVIVLSFEYLKNKDDVTFEQLKKAYQRYLSALQPHCPTGNSEKLFYSDHETELLLNDYFAAEEVDVPENDLESPILYPDPLQRQQILECALSRIEKNDSTFTDIFKLVMNIVFCTATPRIGGTSVNPRYIGVMCAYYDMMAEESVVPELLIHEFTHNALFLDELRYGHYKETYDALDKNTFLPSTYMGKPFQFPFHRCLHSLVVSAEILSARKNYIGHEEKINQHLPTPGILARSKDYIHQIENKKDLYTIMTERGEEIFATCQAFYKNY